MKQQTIPSHQSNLIAQNIGHRIHTQSQDKQIVNELLFSIGIETANKQTSNPDPLASIIAKC